MEENEKKKSRALVHNVLWGVLSSLVITGLSLLVISVIYLTKDLSDETARNLVTASALISVLVSSLLTGRSLKHRGLLSGCLVGAVYSLSLYFTGFLAFGFPGFGKGLLSTLALCILSGGLGGIAGVNLRSKKR